MLLLPLLSYGYLITFRILKLISLGEGKHIGLTVLVKVIGSVNLAKIMSLKTLSFCRSLTKILIKSKLGLIITTHSEEGICLVTGLQSLGVTKMKVS